MNTHRLHTLTARSGPTCRARGCSNPVYGPGPYCRSCRTRRRRHGDERQQTISKHELKPYVREVREWLDQRPEENGWAPMRDLWKAFVSRTAGIHERERWKVDDRYARGARADVLRVAADADADEIILTLAALWRMQETAAHRFASDDGFRAQLARQFRRLSDGHVATSIDRTTNKVKRVYRDVPRRQLIELGEALSVALGGLCLTVSRTMDIDERARSEQRREAYRRLSTPTAAVPSWDGSAHDGSE